MKLEIRNIHKVYKIGRDNRFKALKDVSLNFESGELVSVIGESGSGKSTLMNLIGGLDNDYQGQILIDGQDIHQYKEKQLDAYRKNKVGFVFQSFNLIPHLSVLDNVAIAMTLSNVSRTERMRKSKKLLEEVGLGDQIHKKPNQLSGGQKQRVAIARALINDPEIILADEPTGSLDSETSEQVLQLIRGIAAKCKLVIMVTHSDKVAAYSNRIIKISDGRIVEDIIREREEAEVAPSCNQKGGKQNLSFLSAIGLAMKNMREKLARNTLVSIGASIGITSVILMLSIGNGVEAYITNTMKEYVNPLVVEVNKLEDQDENAMPGNIFMAENKPFSEDDIKVLQEIDNVKTLDLAYSKVAFNENYLTLGEERIAFQNLRTVSSNITSENITEGTMPGSGELLVSASLNSQFQESLVGKTVGISLLIDKVEIRKEYQVSGLYGEISDSGMEDFHMVFMNFSDLQEAAGQKGLDISPNTIYLTAVNEKDVQGIKDAVTDLGFQGSKEELLLGMFNEMLDVITYILSAIAAISLVVSAIMILVVMYISVVERTREIGVLKAIGARRKDIKRVFVAEAFLIGLGSGIFGVVSAFVLMILINGITQKLYEVDLVLISIYYVLFGILVSIIISMLSGLAPAGKAAKLDPVESLRRE